MSAFNDVDGVPATANPFTLTKVLRGEWGFDGLVVSDYTSVMELLHHRLAADEAEAAQKALVRRHRHGDGQPLLREAPARRS